METETNYVAQACLTLAVILLPLVYVAYNIIQRATLIHFWEATLYHHDAKITNVTLVNEIYLKGKMGFPLISIL